MKSEIHVLVAVTQDKHICVYKVVPVLHVHDHDIPIKEALDEF